MGIAKLYAFLRKHSTTSVAWNTDNSYPTWQPGTVVIFDELTKWHNRAGPNRDYQFRTIDFITLCLAEKEHYLKCGAHAVIMCMDESRLKGLVRKNRYAENINEAKQTKREEEHKRSGKQTKDVEPYGSHAVLCLEGIYEDSKNHPGVITPLNTKRMMHNKCRFIRRQLCELMATYLMTDAFVVPKGGTFIFDYTFDGPLIIQHDDKGCRRTEHNTMYCHFLWEADLAMWYWVRQFHTHPIWIDSIDSDVIPIGLYFLVNCAHKVPIYWIDAQHHERDRRTDKVTKVIRYCRMQKLLHQFLTVDKWHFDHLLHLFLICGTDYLEKKWFSHMIGVQNVYARLLKLSQKDNDTVASETATALNELCATIRQHAPPAVTATFITYHSRYNWNFFYWYRNWSVFVPFPVVAGSRLERPAYKGDKRLDFIWNNSQLICDCEKPEDKHDAWCGYFQWLERRNLVVESLKTLGIIGNGKQGGQGDWWDALAPN